MCMCVCVCAHACVCACANVCMLVCVCVLVLKNTGHFAEDFQMWRACQTKRERDGTCVYGSNTQQSVCVR